MANLGKVPPEADTARDWCCKALTELVRLAEGEITKARPRAVGLQVAHVFDVSTAEYKYKFSPLVYVVPGRGQGKARQKAQHILINYCPFCGRKLDSE